MSTRKMYESRTFRCYLGHRLLPGKAGTRPSPEPGGEEVWTASSCPSVTTMPTENTEKTSESMCAVVKGYPIVVKNSDNPKRQWGIPFDAPLFHWYTEEDRNRQLITYMKETFRRYRRRRQQKAIAAGEQAQESFRAELKRQGAAMH